MKRRSATAALPALLAAGCLSGPAPVERPARIVQPDEASRAALERAVSEALYVDGVTLADDALTESSVLVLERGKVRSLEAPAPSGRDLGTPERFRLLKSDDRCVLVHDGSGRRYVLASTDCVAE